MYSFGSHLFDGLRPLSMTALASTEAIPTEVFVPSHPCAVRQTPHGAGVFAIRAISRGARILRIDGRLQTHPTRYSIQLDVDVHIECFDHDENSNNTASTQMRSRHPWRFLNHSCEPNARVFGRSLLARRAISAGEQISFDYTTTEAEMAEPFHCGCGNSNCLGLVRGFAHLSAAQQRLRGTRLAPHLRRLLLSDAPSTADE